MNRLIQSKVGECTRRHRIIGAGSVNRRLANFTNWIFALIAIDAWG